MFEISSSYLIYHFLRAPELWEKPVVSSVVIICHYQVARPSVDVSTEKLHYFQRQIRYFVCVVGGRMLSFCGAIQPIGTSLSDQERKLSRPVDGRTIAHQYQLSLTAQVKCRKSHSASIRFYQEAMVAILHLKLQICNLSIRPVRCNEVLASPAIVLIWQ